MTDYDDLDWLAAQQPVVPSLGVADARRARSELLAHMTGRRAPLAPARPSAPTRRAPERRWIRPSRVLALTAVATAAAVAALAIGGGGADHVGGVDQALGAPLVRLSSSVRHVAAQPGDATLVLRRQVLADGETITGADLYLDNGDYYYAPTLAGLPAALAAHQTAAQGWIPRLTAAAVAALHLDIAQARAGMAKAAIDPSQPAPPAAPAQTDAQIAAAAIKKEQLTGPSRSAKPATQEDLANNWIWGNSLDALVAGGGRPDVRAGVLRLLASIPAVAVSQTTSEGRPALALDARVFADNYEEHLVIDAETGIPLRFSGGVPGKAPGIVITYTVTRVTAADIAKG
jgi:hypothetical protein